MTKQDSSTRTPPTHDPVDPVVADTLPQGEAAQEQARQLSTRHSLPPATIPGYTILRILGEGAYGAVWLAREQNTSKMVAVKFYMHRRGLDWSLLNREVEKLAVLYTSRNIVGLIDVGWDNTPPFYVMEYLENGSVANLLQSGSLPVAEAVRIAHAVLQALVHAHGSGILHCDLKPANILLDRDYEPRLCDFGQSRLSHEQKPALGTLFYMAPEQADFNAVPDARWDVYALGALLYNMLTGVSPFRDEHSEKLIREADGLEERLSRYRRLIRDGARPGLHRKVPGVDRALADIVDRCLNHNPDRRYPNAQAVLEAMDRRERRRARRPLIVLGVVGPAVLLCIMAFIVGKLMQSAVNSARDHLTQRALESDALPVRILARTVENDLANKTSELERIASDPQLCELVKLATLSHEERLPLTRLLSDRHAASQTHLPEEVQDTSWFLTDAVGIQRWRQPWTDRTIDRPFGFRDYFHGHNREYEEASIAVVPIRKPHISIPFLSKATGHYMVAISVPIWDEQHETVIGVLARTKELGKFQAQFGRSMLSQDEHNSRVVALVDRRAGWRLIDHPWMTPDNILANPEAVASLTLEPALVTDLEQAYGTADAPLDGPPDFRVTDFQDPIRHVNASDQQYYGQKWLAAFSPISNTSWLAVVQEPRERAWEPIDDMKAGLIEYGLWALAICFGFIIVLWGLVLRAIRDRALRLRLQNGTARQSSMPSTISMT